MLVLIIELGTYIDTIDHYYRYVISNFFPLSFNKTIYKYEKNILLEIISKQKTVCFKTHVIE